MGRRKTLPDSPQVLRTAADMTREANIPHRGSHPADAHGLVPARTATAVEGCPLTPGGVSPDAPPGLLPRCVGSARIVLMRVDVRHDPSFTVARCVLAGGESV